MTKFVYVIRKDGMYLIGYSLSSIKEFDSHGNLMPVYTCVWGDRRTGAKAFNSKARANEVRRMIGGDDVEKMLAEVGDDES